jgi:hypothetical protein
MHPKKACLLVIVGLLPASVVGSPCTTVPPTPQPTDFVINIPVCAEIEFSDASYGANSPLKNGPEVYLLRNGKNAPQILDVDVVANKNIDHSKPLYKRQELRPDGSIPPTRYLFFHREYKQWVVTEALGSPPFLFVGRSTNWYPWDTKTW